jgi:hypothetical protein
MSRANKAVYHPHGDSDDFKTVEDALDSLDDRVTQNETDIGTSQTDITTLQSDMTTAQTDISDLQAQQEVIDFTIESPDNQDYLFEIDAPYGYTITQVDSGCRSGTCTATTKIGGTALGGGANSVSTTLQSKTHSTNNTIAAGGTSVVTISSNSSCAGLRLVFWITRT